MDFHVVLEPAPEGGFVVRCVEIPGAVSQGDTEQEALDNAKDAIEMILGVRRDRAQKDAAALHSTVRTISVHA